MIVLRDLTFGYRHRNGGRHDVLSGITCTFKPGTISVILGPSGCGKTTLLNLLARLEAPSAGSVRMDEQVQVGYVFQHAVLVPWLTVRENAVFGADLTKIPRAQSGAIAARLLLRYGFTDALDVGPRTLSGGMQQRLGIVRAITGAPDLLLLDEPLAHSDFAMRRVIQHDLSDLVAERGVTIVLATHDHHEAVLLADQLILLAGTPSRIIDCIDIDTPREARLQSDAVTMRPVLDRLWNAFATT